MSSKKKRKYLIFVLVALFLVLATATMIYYFSSQNGEESTETSRGFTLFVLRLFNPNYDDLTVEEQLDYCSNLQYIVRKLAHFSEFFLLGFFLELYLDMRRYKMAPIISLILGVLYAFFDEWHQSFVEERGPGITDVLIDSSGVLSGILIMFVIRYFYKKFIVKCRNKLQSA